MSSRSHQVVPKVHRDGKVCRKGVIVAATQRVWCITINTSHTQHERIHQFDNVVWNFWLICNKLSLSTVCNLPFRKYDYNFKKKQFYLIHRISFLKPRQRTSPCFSPDCWFCPQMDINGKVCGWPNEKHNTLEQESRSGLSEGHALMVRRLRIG